MISAELGIRLMAISPDETRRIPVTLMQEPLTTDVIVMLQGSAAVRNKMVQQHTNTKKNANSVSLLTP
jgi:hypothetical protein